MPRVKGKDSAVAHTSKSLKWSIIGGQTEWMLIAERVPSERDSVWRYGQLSNGGVVSAQSVSVDIGAFSAFSLPLIMAYVFALHQGSHVLPLSVCRITALLLSSRWHLLSVALSFLPQGIFRFICSLAHTQLLCWQ